MSGVVGDIKTVDFHWNISHDHLMRYVQCWHGERDRGGILWVHKSTHQSVASGKPVRIEGLTSLKPSVRRI